MEELIRRVIATLDKVEVKGKENLDLLLGSMLTLEKIANAIKSSREAMNQGQQEEGGEDNATV